MAGDKVVGTGMKRADAGGEAGSSENPCEKMLVSGLGAAFRDPPGGLHFPQELENWQRPSESALFIPVRITIPLPFHLYIFYKLC